MASTTNKQCSKVWDHFDLIEPNKVRCLQCTQVLSYSNNTSSMLRHLGARHDDNHTQQTCDPFNTGNPDTSRKQKLDEALMDMIVKDGQPFSIIEDERFQNFIKILDPSFSIPSCKTVKAMVEARVSAPHQQCICQRCSGDPEIFERTRAEDPLKYWVARLYILCCGNLHAMAERRTIDKLRSIMDNVHHPLHTVIHSQRSLISQRLRLPKFRTNRLGNSFIPRAIRLFNSSQGGRRANRRTGTFL
ncbi:hypothetical protein D4764_17G0005530 [Takifugu flavidus]|uniref:BED-type domain-containing protein n=1 Tax=Takifugu flavidus TaxID=433684 RepID=A0A5C6NYQ8_9TELE|nr:hypothetical protein D4764_17G0005530 [Takifugu flavidus]